MSTPNDPQKEAKGLEARTRTRRQMSTDAENKQSGNDLPNTIAALQKKRTDIDDKIKKLETEHKQHEQVQEQFRDLWRAVLILVILSGIGLCMITCFGGR
jgi:tRNA uridine 5-carbamoylmethylation protein Kti12